MSDYTQRELFPRSCVEGSPAKTSPLRKHKPKDSMESAVDCGESMHDSSIPCDPSGLSSKPCLLFSVEALPESYKISSRAGMTRSGRVYELTTFSLPILEIAYGLWPTPSARDHRSGKASSKSHAKNSRPLNAQVTHHVHGSFDSNIICGPHRTRDTGETVSLKGAGSLNPEFVCWLMGYPTEFNA